MSQQTDGLPCLGPSHADQSACLQGLHMWLLLAQEGGQAGEAGEARCLSRRAP